MKKVLMVMMLVFTATAAAKGIVLTKRDKAINQIKEAELMAVQLKYPDCPPNALCMPSAVAQVRVMLSSCVNRLGPIAKSITYDEVSGKTILSLSVTEIIDVNADRVRCAAIHTTIKDIHVGGPWIQKEDLVLNVLK